jgi:translation initiation factor IF-2
VRDTFNIPKIGVVAGAGVVDGKIERGCNIRLLRDGKIVYDGKLSTLKRFKDEVKEVKNGYECGLGLENFNDVRKDDVVEAYIMETRKRTLESVSQVTL